MLVIAIQFSSGILVEFEPSRVRGRKKISIFFEQRNIDYLEYTSDLCIYGSVEKVLAG